MLWRDDQAFSGDFIDAIVRETAKRGLSQRLFDINVDIRGRQKARALTRLHELLSAINDPAGQFSEFEQKELLVDFLEILNVLAVALSTVDDNQKRGTMARIEEWHAAGKLRFILFLPELRQLVFS